MLDIRSGDALAQWMVVPVVGRTPGRRYGHTLVYAKPNLLVFGGNNSSETVNDVWCLNVEKAPFCWAKLEIAGELPPARTYHSAALCTFGSAQGMMVIFGGRSGTQAPLADTWGLRKHRDGRWDWVVAPYKQHTEPPLPRYQHGGEFVASLMLIVGGRTTNGTEQSGLEIYDTETSEWHKFPTIRRFRHAEWVIGSVLFIYGGFEADNPNLPTDTILRFDLLELLASHKTLLYKLNGSSADKAEQFVRSPHTPGTPILPSQGGYAVKPAVAVPGPGPEKAKPAKKPASPPEAKGKTDKERTFRIAPTAVMAVPPSAQNPAGKILRPVPIEKLQEETKKLAGPLKGQKVDGPESTAELFAEQLLRPREWAMQKDPSGKFPYGREHIVRLADQCLGILQQQPMVLRLRAPIKVFGDIHGQYQDLMRFFDLWGTPSDEVSGDIEAYDYLFLGDYVDRGSHSLETVCLMLALKVKYPKQVHLLRGNHEDRWINNAFGFAEECSLRLGEDPNDPMSVFNKVNDVFDWLPLAATIEERIVCLHGGIGSTLQRLEQIEELKRPLEVIHEVQTPIEQLVVDILWSDPTDSDQELGIQANYIRDPNSTGNIVKFGPDKVEEFLKRNSLDMILRAHECVMDGFERFAGGTLITVFSATDYCGRHKNAGAVLIITRKFEIIPKLIYPLSNDESNWMDDEASQNKRPPTPPRWNAASFPRNQSFN